MAETKLTKDSGNAGVQAFGIGKVHKVAFSDTSVESPVITEGITLVEVSADQDCHIVTGPSPQTATTANKPLWQKQPQFPKVRGGIDVIAVIRAGAANGNLYITEQE